MAQVAARPRIGVIQFPGVNCEYETVRAIRAVGLRADVVRSNSPRSALTQYQGFVLPGGFSYQDRVRAGAISAREPVLEFLTEAAEKEVPILGICNGAQALVEAGLVPGVPAGEIRLALAANHMPERSGYYTRWIFLRVTREPCAFTRAIEPDTVLPMPVAHGEGRFTTADPVLGEELRRGGRIAFRYCLSGGDEAVGFPDNPNGSIANAAGVTGGAGNVLALMPHPERATWIWQLPPSLDGAWGQRRRRWSQETAASTRMTAPGPGRLIFESLARYLEGRP